MKPFMNLDEVEFDDVEENGLSQKVLIVTGKPGQPGLRKMFRAENTVHYYDREQN